MSHHCVCICGHYYGQHDHTMGYEEQYNKLRGACGLDVKFIT